MHVVEDLHVVLAQFLSSGIARGQRLARHNEPTHSRTLARRTDKSPKLRFLMYFASSRRITRRVGGEGRSGPGRHSEPQLAELLGVALPVLGDLDPQIQEDLCAEQLFDLRARVGPHLA
ncbi:Uncharacterised protein [Mycobacteroides abscessus subsp. massiliense]|nr:Uncharacterised protein [Mycobacteroides abscessus subsp. massiliense]